MTAPAANNYRRATWTETIARMLPASGLAGWVRRWLRPFHDRLLDRNRQALVATLPGGERVQVAPAFRHITWNADEYAAFRSVVKPGQTVLDIGANVGSYAVLFGQWAGSTGRVYAFEPDPSAFRGLSEHVALNHLATRVVPVPAVMAECPRESVRFAVSSASGTSHMASDGNEAGTIDAPCRSIDDFCTEAGITPDVIKIDVEGAELQVLRGARQTIARAGGALQLFVEMHPHLWKARGISAADLEQECQVQHLVAERLDGSTHDVWGTEGVCVRLRRNDS